jgi:hypothetical protein
MQKGMAFYTPDVDLITGLPGPATRGTTSGAVRSFRIKADTLLSTLLQTGF